MSAELLVKFYLTDKVSNEEVLQRANTLRISPEGDCSHTNPVCGTHREKESIGSDRVDRRQKC